MSVNQIQKVIKIQTGFVEVFLSIIRLCIKKALNKMLEPLNYYGYNI